jgi:catechol 2,3-dioxygenase-like lactoylglutathione lyase family enzyme
MNGPKVIGLNGVGLQVPDVGAAEKFYGAFGLVPEKRSTALGLRSPGRATDEIVVLPGASQKRMHHLSFVIRPGDEDAFAQKLKSAGLQTSAAPNGAPRAGLWFQDPWGTWINLAPGKSLYEGAEPEGAKPSGGAAREAAKRQEGSERVDVARWRELDRDPRPARIGHMLMFTPDWHKSEEFFSAVLGLRTTDRAAGKVSFMAAGNGIIDHHCFGLIPSTHRGFQHASFKVGSIDDIGFGVWRLRNAGYKDTFGPGRHALASNLFHYIRDPWGSWIEYYADMDRVSDNWQCRDWNELPYVWGPEWAPEFWGKEMNGNFEPA